jgi:hypothetical protein
MKRISAILCIICFAVFFIACQKEGVYTPSKKIDKITCHYIGGNIDYVGETTVTQQWVWNKNGTVKEIKTDNGVIYKFTYIKKNRLVRVDIIQSLGQCYYEYIYEGETLKETRMYRNESTWEQAQIYTFTHTGKKITGIDYEMSSKDYTSSSEMVVGMFSPMQCVLPEDVVGFMEKEQKEMAKKCAAKGMTTVKVHCDLTWSGGNVTKLEWDVSGESFGYEEPIHVIANYTYDHKKNPFRNFLLGDTYDYVFNAFQTGCFANKNNVVKMEVTYDNPNISSFSNEFEYDYKGSYPVSKTGDMYSETFEYK